MKKYRIKNADGSEQTVMQAVHESRKEAGETLMDYICDHNEDLNIDDDDYLSPFDFVLEEVECKEVNDINPKHLEALIALNKLFTIAEAWNKEDGFVPDFSDWNQNKWFPWFLYDKDAAGFVFADTDSTSTVANANISSRLCFKSSARAAQFGKQFAELYNKVFL